MRKTNGITTVRRVDLRFNDGVLADMLDLFSAMRSRTYVIPDIHGRYDLLLLALAEITRRQALQAGEHRVIFTGDYIDRGPQSCQVVEHLRQGILRGEPWTMLMGNHEEMMLLVERKQIPASDWLRHGGKECLESYRGSDGLMAIHIAFLGSLPSVLQDAHRVYVHACVDDSRDLERQDEMLRWGYFKGDTGYRGKHVVHGHQATTGEPVLLRNRTNLDCGAVKNGRLVFAQFDDDRPGGPVEVLSVTAGSRRARG